MKSLLEYIVNHIVDHPEDVNIDEREIEGVKTFIIKTHTEDIGKVIGKQGHTIQAIRTLIRARSFRDGEYVRVEIAEPAQNKEESSSTEETTISEEAPTV